MKFSLLILTGLTLLATGCSHKGDDGGQRQGFNGPDQRRDGRLDDQRRGQPGRFHKQVRVRPHGPLMSSLTCVNEQGGREEILLDQFSGGTAELVVGTEFTMGARPVRVLSRDLSGRNASRVRLSLLDVTSGDVYQSDCAAF